MLSLLPENIRNKIYIEPNTGCWLWLGSLFSNGYGQTWWNKKVSRVHRVTYQIFKGEIPSHLVTDHLCKTRSCCNPDHIEIVPQKINVARGKGNPDKWKTHCKRGHPFEGENLRITRGKRYCQICTKMRNDAWYHNKNK